jgi:ferric-dicitrate binding protein FerR (iron transport regulator)
MKYSRLLLDSISRLLRGKASHEDIKDVNDWYDSVSHEDVFIEDHKNRTKSMVKQELWDRVSRNVAYKKPAYKRWVFYAAASLSLLLVTFYMDNQMTHSPAPDESFFKTVENGAGMKKRVKLPDGSEVVLFHHTQIEIAEDFSQNRNLKLKGKALFHVSRDEDHPFTVSTDQSVTTVLGTSFVIETCLEEGERVAVKEGLVAVRDAGGERFLLNRNEMLTIRQGGSIKEPVSDERLAFGWADDWIVFESTGVAQAMTMLEDWFGVEIDHDLGPGNNGCLLTGAYHKMSLEHILEAIKYSIPLDYEMYKNKISISFKSCK